ncbi:MAG: FecR family protein [bacterium]
MKKTFFILGGIVVLGVIIFLLLPTKSLNDEIVNNVPEKIPSIFTVTPLSSDVSIKTATSSNFNVIQNVASTSEGTEVKTSTSGRALIESSFGHPISLDFNSDITVKNSDEEKDRTSIELVSGGIWARAKKLVEKGEYLEIKTGNAVAVVRGTSFGLTYSNDKTILLVSEGEVSLFNKDKATGEPIASSEILVKAGGKGIVFNDNNATTSLLDASDMNNPWYQLNTSIDGTAPKQNPTNQLPSPALPKILPPRTQTNTTPGPSGSGPAVAPTNTTTGAVTQITTTPAKEISVRFVTPNTISAGDTKTIIFIAGAGLKNVTDVVLGELPVLYLSIPNDNSLSFYINTQSTPGTYDIELIRADGTYYTVPNALTITSALR